LAKGVGGAERDFIPHEDAQGVDFLPLVPQAGQAADLEVAGGDVDAFGELAPVVEVAQDFPIVVAVVDDEQLGMGETSAGGNADPGRESAWHDVRRPSQTVIGLHDQPTDRAANCKNFCRGGWIVVSSFQRH
jgi:hypothetical protein